MIAPVAAGEELHRQFGQFPADPKDLAIWWLGQSGFLVHGCGRFVLFDPYLSDSLTCKYAGTDKPHVRMTKIPIASEQLRFADVVTASHQHTDHLDAETLRPLLVGNPYTVLVAPAAHEQLVLDRSGAASHQVRLLNDGMSCEAHGIRIHAIPAAHESLERDEKGRCKFLGYIVQLGDWTLYHSGDTVRFTGMSESLSKWRIDIAFLPINGALASRKVAGNLWGREAVELAGDAGIKLVIPCHYEMFTFNTVSPDEFIQTAELRGQKYKVLRCGESWTAVRSEFTFGTTCN